MSITASTDPCPDAMCRQSDPELWFSGTPRDIATAQSICGQCPHQQACREYAAEMGETWGVWGGVDYGALGREAPSRLCRDCDALISAKAIRCVSCNNRRNAAGAPARPPRRCDDCGAEVTRGSAGLCRACYVAHKRSAA